MKSTDRLARLYARQESAERAMTRAFNRWRKLSAQIRRLNKKMESEFVERADRRRSDIPSDADWRALTDEANAELFALTRAYGLTPEQYRVKKMNWVSRPPSSDKPDDA